MFRLFRNSLRMLTTTISKTFYLGNITPGNGFLWYPPNYRDLRGTYYAPGSIPFHSIRLEFKSFLSMNIFSKAVRKLSDLLLLTKSFVIWTCPRALWDIRVKTSSCLITTPYWSLTLAPIPKTGANCAAGGLMTR